MKKTKKEFIAYKGSEYTIEWFFNDKGKSEPQEEMFLPSCHNRLPR